jgi:replicative DNA helicase
VLFIYRPEYYKIDEDEQGNNMAGIAEIGIAKHRNGALADIKLRFINELAKFTDLDKGDYDLDLNGMGDDNGTRTVPSKLNDMKDSDEDIPF